jgi:hypothetical protein
VLASCEFQSFSFSANSLRLLRPRLQFQSNGVRERMASSLLVLYRAGGGGRKASTKRSGGKAAWRSAAPVRKLLRRLWRKGTARPRRAAVTFAYDLESYSQNFDDGHYRL